MAGFVGGSVLKLQLLILLFALYNVRCMPVVNNRVDVYIKQEDLEVYFTDTSLSDTIAGSKAYIIQNTTSSVLSDRRLLLSATGKPLQAFPYTVDSVTITWTTVDIEATYEIEISELSPDIFSYPSISVPDEGRLSEYLPGFSVSLNCDSSSKGTLLIKLKVTSITGVTQADFILEKNCKDPTFIEDIPWSPERDERSAREEGSGPDDIQSSMLNIPLSPSPSSTQLSVPDSTTSNYDYSTLCDPYQCSSTSPSLLTSSTVTSSIDTTSMMSSSSFLEEVLPPSSVMLLSSSMKELITSSPEAVSSSSDILSLSSSVLSSSIIETIITSTEVLPSSSTIETTPSSSSIEVTPSSSTIETTPSSSIDVISSSSTVEATPSSSGIEVTPSSSTVEATPSSSSIEVTPSSSTVEATPSSSSIEVTPLSSTVEATPSSSIEVIPSSSTVEATPSSSSIDVIPSSSTVEATPSSSSIEVISSSTVEATPSSSNIEVISSSSTVEATPSSSSIEVISSSSTVEATPSSSIEIIPSSSTVEATSSTLDMVLSSTPSNIMPSSSTIETPSLSSTEVVPSSSTIKSMLSSSPLLSFSTIGIVPSSSSIEFLSSFILSVTPSITPSITSTTNFTEPSAVPLMLFTIVFTPVILFLILSIFTIVCFLCFIKCARKKERPFADNPNEVSYDEYALEEIEMSNKYKKLETPISIWMCLPWGDIASLPQHIQTMVRTLNIDRRKIAITANVLKGNHGCLSRGMLMMDKINPSNETNIGVVMKILTGLGDRGRREDITRFIEQAGLMQGLEHPNILPLCGISIEDNCVPVALYPFSEYGNIHVFLELCSTMPEESPLNPFSKELKVNFSYQLASAMKFLSDKNIIHNDLALRNCWLDTGFKIKISDGALSQEFYPNCYTIIKGAMRPVKWSAIETLQEGLITTQSNVWSFGVMIWEIFSVAKMPYDDIPNKSILSHLMMDGRLSCPSDDCPESLFSLLQTCWYQRAEERPKFNKIYTILRDLNSQFSPSHRTQPLPNHNGPLSPDISCTTFGKDLSSTHQPIPVTIEQYPFNGISDSIPHVHTRHSNTSYEANIKRFSAQRGSKRSSGRLSTSSLGRQADKVSLSFSVLDNVEDSSESDSDEDGEGSFPSTLKSKCSINTAPNLMGTQSSSEIMTAESLATLQPLSPSLPQATNILSVSPDLASKTSILEESVSDRSSILIPATASGTDRSSFYSTGIDSISTTFSTPLPLSLPPNHPPNAGIETRTYGFPCEDHPTTSTHPLSNIIPENTLDSVSPQIVTTPFKSTDSGIRSDEESNSSESQGTGNHDSNESHVTSNGDQVVKRIQIPNTNDQSRKSRASSHASQTSFTLFGDLGLTDMSSELMATFDSFSTFKS